jgi:predicted nucleic acid-binding protein
VIFWDASAIVPLLVAERMTAGMQALARGDQDMLVWWGSTVECFSALARLEREAALDAKAMTLAAGRLEQLAGSWHEIEPTEVVRESALRFLRVHALRAADALQLAAAFIAAEHRPVSLQFLTLDERLAGAARKEGFAMVEIPPESAAISS